MSDIEMRGDNEPSTPIEGKDTAIFRDLWNLFSSMKTAIVLLLILAVASVAGTLSEGKKSTDMYASWWYSTILILVGINLLVCSINRFGMAWKRTFEPEIDVTAQRVGNMKMSETVECAESSEAVANKVINALRSRSYRLIRRSGSEGKAISIYAAKGRACIWGPYLTHLSILVIFAGAIYGGKTGSMGSVNIYEGNRVSQYVSENTEKVLPFGFEVGLKTFKVEYDNGMNPTAFKSDLQIYKNGKQVAQKVIDVNHPLSYKGFTLFQSSYGLFAAVEVNVTAPDGTSVLIPYSVESQHTENGLEYVITDDPLKQFKLGGKVLTLYVHNVAPNYVGGEQVNAGMLPKNPGVQVMINDNFSPEHKNLKDWRSLGWLTTSTSADYKGFTVTLGRAVNFTGLSVSRNPGLPVIYLGFTLMILGVFASFYLSFKVIRISIAPSAKGVSVVMGASSKAEMSTFDKDFKRLRDALATP